MGSLATLQGMQWLATISFFSLWAVIGWHDYHHQKIKHNLVLWGAFAILACYALMLVMTWFGTRGVLKSFPVGAYYVMVASHLAVSAFVALLLWWLGVWPAGDAKLFTLLAALYPVMNAASPQRYERLFLAALVNTFIPAALFLFVRAAAFIYDTRLRHHFIFLKQLGWRRELAFFLEKWLSLGAAMLRELPGQLKRTTSGLKADPRAALGVVASWLFSMIGMSLFSCYLTGFFASPLRLSLLWTGLFILWRRVVELFGPAARWVAGAAVIALLIFRPPADWRHFAVVFQNITVFSFFMFLGMNWAIKLVSGGEGLPFALPFLLPFLGMAAGQLISLIVNALRSIANAIGSARGGPGFSFGPWQAGPAVSRFGSEAHSALLSFGGLNSPMIQTLFILASMGLFFGLSLVMVRLWDQETRPVRSAKTLAPFLLLAPAFVERLRLDAEFFEAHFRKLYPDGLTRDQVEALKGWCKRHGVEEIPLEPTMSFAAWIFLGYFLSHLLGGGHVLEVLL